MNYLVLRGLFPENVKERRQLQSLNPYQLRAKALDKPISLHEIGRALIHINQRRGFQSNRKTDAESKEAQGMKAGIQQLQERMQREGVRSLGEWLHRIHVLRHDPEHRKGHHKSTSLPCVRFRPKAALQNTNKLAWDFYPNRAMVGAEIEAICQAQQRHHPEITVGLCQELKAIIIEQRPLKPVLPGKCTFNAKEDRAAKALPIAERVRILQELNHLTVQEKYGGQKRCLSLKERDKLYKKLCSMAKSDWKGIRKALGLSDDARFNLESEKRKHLVGDQIAQAVVKVPKGSDLADYIGKAWRKLPLPEQQAIVTLLLGNADDESVLQDLQRQHGLSPAQAENLLSVKLPPGYSRLGLTALQSILPYLEEAVVPYSKACEQAGYNHADEDTGEIYPKLPRYQKIEALNRQLAGTGDPEDPPDKRYGRFPNPTVHIGLNQLRRVVNEMIRSYGHPDEIVLELARDLKNSKKRRDELQREQAKNQEANEKRDAKIAKQDLEVNAENRIRLRLWESLDPDNALGRRCPYSGRVIGLKNLFSPEVEVDHILPFSRTLDNSVSNRTVCYRKENRMKGDLTPTEAVEKGVLQAEHIERACAVMEEKKRWRFAPDAMERFEENPDQFLDRQLHETQWLSRFARIYLSHLCGKNNTYVVPGHLTAMLRGKWRLNNILSADQQKNRNDHRHHAIDAAVIGAVDRWLLQRVARENAKESQSVPRLTIPMPFNEYKDQVEEIVKSIIVSHKPNHGKGGQLHKETLYGIKDDKHLICRKPVLKLTPKDINDGLVCDPYLSQELKSLLRRNEDRFERDLVDWSAKTGIKRIRVLKKSQARIKKIHEGKDYAMIPGEYHYMDIYRIPEGKYTSIVASVYEVNQLGYKSQAPANGEHVMRIHKKDMLSMVGRDGRLKIVCVQKIERAHSRLAVSEHYEAGDLKKRDQSPDDGFKWDFLTVGHIGKKKARPVFVSEIGQVFYKSTHNRA